MQESGLGVFEPREAIAVFEQLVLGDTQGHVGAFNADWTRLVRGPVPPLLEGWAQQSPPIRRGGLLKLLQPLAPEQREAACVTYLRTEARKVLAMSDGETVSATRPLQQLGLDSLMAVQLRNAIADAADLQLPASLLFDYPSLTELARHLLERLQLAPKPVEELSRSRRDDELVASIANLSEEKTEAALEAELRDIEEMFK
jgi:acyl carrier protein